MGIAVARRTIFRPDDADSFGRVADRVALGNMALLRRDLSDAERQEQVRLRNAIATGALLTSGRHLQHGDETQVGRNMEVFTNCATAIASFAKFYLLLNGSGVGRSYDDALVAIDWSNAPTLLLYLSPDHPDYPHSEEALTRLGIDLGLLPWGATDGAETVRAFLAGHLVSDLTALPNGTTYHRVADSREGWAKAVELLESMTFRRERTATVPARPYRDPPRRGRLSAACRTARLRGRSRCCAPFSTSNAMSSTSPTRWNPGSRPC